jgi:hypothetical protein
MRNEVGLYDDAQDRIQYTGSALPFAGDFIIAAHGSWNRSPATGRLLASMSAKAPTKRCISPMTRAGAVSAKYRCPVPCKIDRAARGSCPSSETQHNAVRSAASRTSSGRIRVSPVLRTGKTARLVG